MTQKLTPQLKLENEMGVKRRKRLFFRQSVPSNSWFVGYWEGNRNKPANQDFRVLTSKPTSEAAEQAAIEIAKTEKNSYIFG